MTRVFLSYAEEDGKTANRLVSWFARVGIKLFWWQDAEQRGKRFVGEIEDGIGSADFFVILMSPDYLSSAWCRRECDLAIQRETDLPRQFIYVLNVAETSYAESGFLSGYDWLDLTEPLDDEKLSYAMAAFRLDRVALRGEKTAQARSGGPKPVFRNRDDELNSIVNGLATTGGPDLWLVISPPRMGKSWLLDRLQRELTARVPNCAVRLLDLSSHPLDLRVNPTRLLGALLNMRAPALPASGSLSEAARSAIAAEISKRRRPQLYLLDNADLLDARCAAELRSSLTGIYQLVQRTGTSRFSVVIGSRSHDDWKGLGRDAVRGARFHPVALTEFGVDVVHQALTELDRDLGADQLWDYAKRLHWLTQGLPALLMRGLHWAEETGFLELDDEGQGGGSFDVVVARPYIRADLLSVASLLPFGGDNLGEAKGLLERALRVLVAYRLFTQSHLNYHVEADPGFQSALRTAGWSLNDLWRAVSRTALLTQPLEELWQVIHPPIRRLLYRYYYDSDQARSEAHAIARRFYEGWIDRTAGKEQFVVLVECLWHEAVRMVIEQPSEVPSLLPRVAAELAGDFAKSSIYEPPEFSKFVSLRLREDEEFQMISQNYVGLFDEIVESVVATISGGT